MLTECFHLQNEALNGVQNINQYVFNQRLIFLKVIFFSISYSLLHHLYSPCNLFLNKSVFITIKKFLLLPMVYWLTILRAGWKIAAWIDKWTIAVSKNEQILMDNIPGWKLQQFSWMLHGINKFCNKWVLLCYFLFSQLLFSLTYSWYNFNAKQYYHLFAIILGIFSCISFSFAWLMLWKK